MSLGRNEPCHCGSGKKYKNCHLNKQQSLSPYMKILLAVGGLVILLGIVYAIRSVATYELGNTPTRVWSEEHQHWHSIN